MRFSANQLRILQEDMSAPLLGLSPPPELAPALAQSAPAPQQQQAGRQPQATTVSRVPCWALAPVYGSTGFFCVCAALAWPSALHPALYFAGAAPLPAALVLHALASPHSRPAQALAAVCAAFLPAAGGSAHPLAVAAAALLLSTFFCAAAAGAQGSPVFRLLSPAFALLVFSCAAIALTAGGEAQQLQRGAWLVMAAALCAQAAASSARLRSFELSCAVKPI